MKRIFRYLKPYRLRMALGLAIKFTGTVVELAIPWILSYMIDYVIPRKDVGRIYLWGGAMLLCAVIALIFNITANRMASLVSRNATEQIRNDLFGRVLYLSNRQMDGFTLPSLTSRLTTDTYNVHQMLGMMQRLGVRAPILFLGGILITLTLDPVLTLTMLSAMPFIVILLVFVSRVGVPMFTRLQQKIDQFVRVVREDVSGIRIIKALSKEDYEREKFRVYNEEAAEQERRAGLVMSVLNPGVNLCLNAGMALVLLVGAGDSDRFFELCDADPQRDHFCVPYAGDLFARQRLGKADRGGVRLRAGSGASVRRGGGAAVAGECAGREPAGGRSAVHRI